MRIIKLMLLIALLLTVCAACNGEADKAQDSNDDDDDDNGDDDDDTVPPDEEPQLLASDFNFGPAQCKCPPDEKDDRTPVRVATFNAEGFSQITVQELEDDLDDYDPDIVCIQEVPTAILAEELSSRFGMVHLYSGEATGIVLLSKNVLTPVEVLTLDSGNAAIKARSTLAITS